MSNSQSKRVLKEINKAKTKNETVKMWEYAPSNELYLPLLFINRLVSLQNLS